MQYNTEKSVLVSFILFGVITSGIIYALVGAMVGYFVSDNLSIQILLLSLYYGICGVVGGALWGILCGDRAIIWFMEGQKINSAEPWRNVVSVGRLFGIVLGVLLAILLAVLPTISDVQVNPFFQAVLLICIGFFVGHFASGAAWQNHVSKAARHAGYST